ncbi:2-amino-4-hydroxy-6-hydroxymethyldihydropteridine diphosphokinase [Erythrobacter sp. HL-111]|uniref:2-amino-4-hydroxy-6- hydroxymethyldihydropteridine diphosphokinase n=1 Tax=Erythrobacter sp. HL-111 TaxID=1798193 RepID=UPI0006DA05FF|nr:2-amino-4-hydroxy-6-hydroxymethyldihydropteridine diphosphokinase [Erythrobacter sp. HL-111]KPP83387.1 MAG: 2-amino-4-hydroxy-6-hydroxymethyldihydropteridine diphosphokinase FolK [Erythrobacteraceae bacterium HL-111]SDS97999.1 2-amino-4-hydroxy-6-hydroxymethyldihydropteridinediphosphokinase [Erythrobacter sp. HL-111]
MSSLYLVAIGSNRRHHLYGLPRAVVHAAMEELAALGTVLARSRVVGSAPLGAAQRRFANAASVLASEYDPPALLAALKRMEREFGRRPGRRWGDRVLDLDIVLWSEGRWEDGTLAIPHPRLGERGFVLGPAREIAPGWRDPASGLTIAQLTRRLTRREALPR